MKIFDPKLTGSIEILNTISGNVTIAGGLTVEGSLGGSATTASYVEYSDIANKPTLISSSVQIASDISGSIALVSSSLALRISSNEGSVDSLNQASSSYALKSNISGAFDSVSSSLSSRISSNEGSVSSLNQASSSYLLNTTDTLIGDLTVTGTITAQEFHTEFVSASIVYTSGSTKFGDTLDDKHSFTGSLQVSGSTSTILGNLGINTTPSYNLHNTGTFGFATDVTGNIGVMGANTSTADTYFTLRNTAGRFDVGTSATGHYFYGVGALPLQFFTNATERMRITSSGDVGIGVTSPSNSLHVKRSSSPFIRVEDESVNSEGGLIFQPTGYNAKGGLTLNFNTAEQKLFVGESSNGYFQTFYTNGVERMRITSAGNVGIGTDSTNYKLDTNGSGRFYTAGANTYPLTIQNGLLKADNNYLGLRLISSDTDYLSGIFLLNGGTDKVLQIYAYEENFGFRDLILGGGGKVGIGLTAPRGDLEVRGSQTTNVSYFSTNGAGNRYIFNIQNVENSAQVDFRVHGSTYSETLFGNSMTNASSILGQPAAGAVFAIGNYNNGPLVFGSNNAERMRITSSGDVGIGVTSPSTQLNVGHASHGVGIAYMGASSLPAIAGLFTDSSSGQQGYGSLLIKSRSDYAGYSINFFTAASANTPEERMRITSTGTVQPGANGTQDLGTSSLRWGTVYTSDLSLSNGIGDYTIVEGEEDLFLYNNKTNKVYKFVIQEVDPSTATPKKS